MVVLGKKSDSRLFISKKKQKIKRKMQKEKKKKKLLIQYIIIGFFHVKSKITSVCPKKLTYTYPKSIKCIHMEDQYLCVYLPSNFDHCHKSKDPRAV